MKPSASSAAITRANKSTMGQLNIWPPPSGPAPGEAWRAIESGQIARDGDLPVNPSGGLLGLGHPVGATGVRMVLDAALQTTGRAGEMQVEGARRVGTYNVGGSGTANVSFVVGFPGDD